MVKNEEKKDDNDEKLDRMQWKPTSLFGMYFPANGKTVIAQVGFQSESGDIVGTLKEDVVLKAGSCLRLFRSNKSGTAPYSFCVTNPDDLRLPTDSR